MQIYTLLILLLVCTAFLWRKNLVLSRRVEVLSADRPVDRQERLSDFAASVPGFFFCYRHGADGSHTMPFASPGIVTLFNLRQQDVARSISPLMMRIFKEDWKVFIDGTARSAADLSPLQIEFRTEHAENGLLWIESRAVPMRQEDGSILWHGFMHDITGRKSIEAQLIRREFEFRTLVENSPDVLARYDSECRFVYVNSLFEKLLGFRLRELQGKSPLQIPGLQDAELLEQRVKGVLATGIPDEFEHPLVWPDGRIDWRLFNIVPEFDDQGQIIYAQLSSRSIAPLREFRQYLEASQTRLRRLLVHQGDRYEQERQDISWSMHENLLQILASMHMYASLLNAGSVHKGQEMLLQGLISGLKNSIDLVREAIDKLCPVVLNHGLIPALECLVEQFSCGIPAAHCSLDIDEAASQIDEKSALLIFRIVQEVLACITKDKGDANLCIALGPGVAGFVLTLRDESQAYRVDLHDSNFFSLYGFQELVLEMGGEMAVFDQPDRGLLVEAIFPARQKELSAA